jgi:hypothetical protein
MRADVVADAVEDDAFETVVEGPRHADEAAGVAGRIGARPQERTWGG